MNVKLFIHSIISEKFPDAMMHTEKSKELAESRHVFMKSFLQEWEKEQGSNECESCLWTLLNHRRAVVRFFLTEPANNNHMPMGITADFIDPPVYI